MTLGAAARDLFRPPPCRHAETQCAECATKAQRAQEAREAAVLAQARQRALRGVPGAWTDDAAAFARAARDRRLRRFADSYAPAQGGVIIVGPTGVGKTAAVARCVRRLVRAAATPDAILWVVWHSAGELAQARRQHGLGQGEAPEVSDAMGCALLVVDEVGYEPQDRALWDVVDHRYQGQLPTIITSGATLAELGARYGAGFPRRIVEPRGLVIDLHREGR